MPLLVNLRHLEEHNLQLKGELPVEELELDIHDEMIRVEKPLRYQIEVQQMEHSLLLQGDLHLTLNCQCVRCLKEFEHTLDVTGWTRHLPLQGEEKVPVSNDCVDLTPLVREDILLEFPQHPLCEAGCRGLPKTDVGKAQKTSGPGQSKPKPSAWAELDKLKF
jgi:DUF177 domain-containing protein